MEIRSIPELNQIVTTHHETLEALVDIIEAQELQIRELVTRIEKLEANSHEPVSIPIEEMDARIKAVEIWIGARTGIVPSKKLQAAPCIGDLTNYGGSNEPNQ